MNKNFILIFSIASIVADAQNVGIGVAIPQNKLHVGGGFRLDTLTGVNGAGLLRHDANGVVYGIKFSGNSNDVLRGDGSFGSNPGNGISYWLTNGTHLYNSNTGNVGIGTTTPGSGLELKGAGLGSQQRITDHVSGNSLVLQGGAGGNLKVTGFNYGTFTAQPIYLSVDGANTFINSNGGNVGIGTTAPATKLTVNSILYGLEHTDGTRSLSTYLNSSGGWIGTRSNHPLHFYTNDGGQQMTLTQSGQLGIGTTTPLGGYLLDVAGPVKSFGNASHFVAQATGGTNSWARFYMRSASQSWFIGTSQNFIGNQLYIADETNNQTRFSIQPGGGPIYMQGNATQDLGGYGLPKAMIFLNGDGTLIRCYNGLTGATTGGCGFTLGRIEGFSSGIYYVDFPFDISSRFFSISVENNGAGVSVSFVRESATRLLIMIRNSESQLTDRPVMIIVY